LQRAHDLLEQRVTERTCELRETLGDLEAFSYSLSHDMRAPLRAIKCYSQILEEALPNKLKSGERNYLQMLIGAAQHLDALVVDSLNFSHVARAAADLESVNLDRLVTSLVNDYPAIALSAAHVEVERPLLPVLGHERLLTHTLSNLLSNAVKFTR